MKVKLNPGITELSGTTINTQLVYYNVQGESRARAKVVPNDPKTPDQQRIREIQSLASKKWDALQPEVWKAWQEWALKWGAAKDLGGNPGWPAGRSAFIAAAQKLLILGLEPSGEAPVPMPPPEIESAEELGTGDPHRFAFRIQTRSEPYPSITLPDLMVFARMTPATVKRGRAPYPNQLRSICGVGPGSGKPLPYGEAVVEFENSRYAVETGQRFGFELIPVRVADGVAGKPVKGDTIRL